MLSNAIKFTEEGKINLAVELIEKKGDTCMLKFWVKDTGKGISPEKQSRLFEAFTQVDSSITRKYGGTGLGLAICDKLVRLMGGEIGVDSVEGKGSSFYFTLPTHIQDNSPAIETSHNKPTSRHEQMPIEDLKVLVAEDNEINQLVILSMLERMGLKPSVASDGQEVLDSLEKQDFDLILMDVQMPTMDGIEATREIIAKYGDHAPRIISVSANALPEDRMRYLLLGMNDYLAKPICQSALKSLLEKWARRLNYLSNIAANKID